MLKLCVFYRRYIVGIDKKMLPQRVSSSVSATIPISRFLHITSLVFFYSKGACVFHTFWWRCVVLLADFMYCVVPYFRVVSNCFQCVCFLANSIVLYHFTF